MLLSKDKYNDYIVKQKHEQMKAFGQVGGNTLGAPGSNGFTNLDFDAIQNMNPSQFNQFKNDLTRPQKNMLREYNAFSPY